MIGYLEGKLLKKEHERILLLVNHIGYEIMLPTIVTESLNEKNPGDDISLYIYFHQTERQPKPVLIGFNSEIEKEFFQLFISVDAIGPIKAVQALTMPVQYIAGAIESGDLKTLIKLKGIGKRTAQKILAALQGKTDKFVLIDSKDMPAKPSVDENLEQQVLEILVNQLGHHQADAKKMIQEAFNRNNSISTPEELFDEVYRGEKIQ
ncbi:Holliday junction branch migration complex subunit RuvA [Candidatus Magnetomoraceae bacterium gMMP-15]